MPTIWNRNPADGFLCLRSTRRVLDRWGNCCDYNRCRIFEFDSSGTARDRCLRDAGHTGTCHFDQCFARHDELRALTGDEPFAVLLDPARFRALPASQPHRSSHRPGRVDRST